MALLECRATSVCANRNGGTFCLGVFLACAKPGPALSVQAGFDVWTLKARPLAGLVVPVALGWAVQGALASAGISPVCWWSAAPQSVCSHTGVSGCLLIFGLIW